MSEWDLTDAAVRAHWLDRWSETNQPPLSEARIDVAVVVSSRLDKRPHPWTMLRWAENLPAAIDSASPLALEWFAFLARPGLDAEHLASLLNGVEVAERT